MLLLLGVLRTERDGDGAGGAAFAPQPGVAQLGALVEQVRRAGLPASLVVEGSARPLTGALDVTIYRLAQEALTNVLKHAGTVSRVRVALTYRDDDTIELVVRDDGRGPYPGANGARGPHETGHGLVGMRERVALHDGTLAAGPLEAGGWAVRAILPVERVAATA
jgi:signal transduction histidine kinase